jgi:hypothetical protein
VLWVDDNIAFPVPWVAAIVRGEGALVHAEHGFTEVATASREPDLGAPVIAPGA